MVEVIEENGGKVMLESPIAGISVDRKRRVEGISLKKGGLIRAKRIVASISPHAVVSYIGKEHFKPSYLEKLYSLRLSVSGFQVYLGLDCTLASLGVAADAYIEFFAPSKSQVEQFAHLEAGELGVDNTGWSINYFSNVDASMAPAGKSTLGIFTLTGATDWHALSKIAYREKKRALTEMLISNAERVLPGLKAHIEVCEAGSPRTMTNFTGNPAGALYGFEQSVSQSGLLHRFPQRYPIRGLYQVGAWTFPGAGFIGAMLSARVLVDRYF